VTRNTGRIIVRRNVPVKFTSSRAKYLVFRLNKSPCIKINSAVVGKLHGTDLIICVIVLNVTIYKI
jgi:hypothetical protein